MVTTLFIVKVDPLTCPSLSLQLMQGSLNSCYSLYALHFEAVLLKDTQIKQSNHFSVSKYSQCQFLSKVAAILGVFV